MRPPPATARADDGLSTFTADGARATAEQACARWSLDARGIHLLRVGENALYKVPEESAVVRVARTMDYWADAEKEVTVADWLAQHDFPGAQVIDCKPHPLEVAGHPVTAWRFLDGAKPPHDEVDRLGRVLRRLHTLPPPTRFSLPQLDILERVEPRIYPAHVSEDDKIFLLDRLQELRDALRDVRFELTPCAIHGDAHNANLLIVDDQTVLIDFERFAWGQPEWDLAKTATEYRTAGFWTAEQYELFCSSYGYDVTESEAFPVMRAVTEIKMLTWLMQNIDEDERVRAEYHKRIQTLRTGQQQPWQPF